MIWQRLRALFGLNTERRSFHADERLHRSLQLLSEHEGCSVEEIATRLLDQALAEQAALETARRCWERLTAREQDVVALICLRYTGRQAAARLNISPETVKAHVRAIYRKCELRSRKQLRQLFSGWDFSAWEA